MTAKAIGKKVKELAEEWLSNWKEISEQGRLEIKPRLPFLLILKIKFWSKFIKKKQKNFKFYVKKMNWCISPLIKIIS